VWAKALTDVELKGAYLEGINPKDPALSLFYPFDEGAGNLVKNLGRAGPKYDLLLGQSHEFVKSFGVPNAYGTMDYRETSAPKWAISTSRLRTTTPSDKCETRQAAIFLGMPQPTGYAGQSFLNVKEGGSADFILQYSHPAGVKSCVVISQLPQHGNLSQLVRFQNESTGMALTTKTRISETDLPFTMSSSAYAWLVYSPNPGYSKGDRLSYSVSDGLSISNASLFGFRFWSTNALPEVASFNLTLMEDDPHNLRFRLKGLDSDAASPASAAWIITRLPTKGKLYRTDGTPISAFSRLQV
jgi:hypothetical protein